MTLSMPVLAAIGILFVALLFFAFRRRGDAGDLMGPPRAGGQTVFPRTPLPTPPHAPPGGGGLTPEVEEQVRALLAAGEKINAVKLVRQATGLGLREALDLVEAL